MFTFATLLLSLSLGFPFGLFRSFNGFLCASCPCIICVYLQRKVRAIVNLSIHEPFALVQWLLFKAEVWTIEVPTWALAGEEV